MKPTATLDTNVLMEFWNERDKVAIVDSAIESGDERTSRLGHN